VYKNNKLDGIKIYGGGFGHGSGMSQSAACQMAKKGKGYKEILATFYNDVEITSLQ
jgi:stage II sporulation protein D